jgi:hypothetical protein
MSVPICRIRPIRSQRCEALVTPDRSGSTSFEDEDADENDSLIARLATPTD